MNDHRTAGPVSDDPAWFLDDPELVTALVHWAMSKGAIIRRDWLGLPPRTAGGEQARLDRERAALYPDEVSAEETAGMPLDALTPMQATIALRRLGYPLLGEIAAILSAARKNGQHLTARHLVSFHGSDKDGRYVILPASRVTHYASAASGYETRWLREIRDIAGEVAVTDAEAGGRIRALLFPPHMHDYDGTVEGCPGCFPPGEVIGAAGGPVPGPAMTMSREETENALRAIGYPEGAIRQAIEHAPYTSPQDGPAFLARHSVTWDGFDAYRITDHGPAEAERLRAADGHELDWLLSVIPVVDQCLDDLAPEVFRRDDDASRIANMYRRFAAGPVSEAAEAIDALNGVTGGNPRKGITHSRADLLGEAADTAFSALLAIQSQTKDIAATWAFFIEAAAKAYSRVPDGNRPGTSGEETARGRANR